MLDLPNYAFFIFFTVCPFGVRGNVRVPLLLWRLLLTLLRQIRCMQGSCEATDELVVLDHSFCIIVT